MNERRRSLNFIPHPSAFILCLSPPAVGQSVERFRTTSRGFSMTLFRCLKWPEMRGAAVELIARVRDGHARGSFRIPVVDFLRVFSPGASATELAKVAERGDL